MTFDLENLQKQIPYYLSAQDKKVLVEELNSITSGGSADYTLSKSRDSFWETMLQGDGWRGFQLYIFETGAKLSVRGLVLSNSCDIAQENPREQPTRVLFAPLVKLSTFQDVIARQIGEDRALAKINSIKAQKTTSIFYLPAGAQLAEDHIVRFDEAQSMPVAAHSSNLDKEKLFTLSNTGFYMLVLKLSVHFCRLQENVHRTPAAQ